VDTGSPADNDETAEDAGTVRRIGRDPGTIPLEVLTAAGHPDISKEGVRNIVRRMNVYGDRDDDWRGLTLKRLRERYCYPCRPSEDSFSAGPSMSGIRNCDIIDCPV
jgi:hypothetical protein